MTPSIAKMNHRPSLIAFDGGVKMWTQSQFSRFFSWNMLPEGKLKGTKIVLDYAFWHFSWKLVFHAESWKNLNCGDIPIPSSRSLGGGGGELSQNVSQALSSPFQKRNLCLLFFPSISQAGSRSQFQRLSDPNPGWENSTRNQSERQRGQLSYAKSIHNRHKVYKLTTILSDIYFLQRNKEQHEAALALRDAVLRLRRDGAFIAVPLFRVNTEPIDPHPAGEPLPRIDVVHSLELM